MTGMIARWRALRDAGVLGINQRNADFVLPLNPRRFYPQVDDKLITKRLAADAGIPTPHSLGVISYHHQLRSLPRMIEGLRELVIKPARGAQGNGIVVIVRVDEDGYHKSSGAVLSYLQIRQHVSSTVSGVFSFHGEWDHCILESRLTVHPCFEPISRFGIPDIRVIVYRGLPVMAMCRLPTAQSDGRANLHQGAIAVGIDIATGRAVHAAFLNEPIARHVDTGAPVVGFTVPEWSEVLGLAARASEISGLGYIGVDLVLDARLGPVLLELNARPGLAIQIANDDGLLPRLRRADRVEARLLKGWKERCTIARELFAHRSA